jgi:hypothetical protein
VQSSEKASGAIWLQPAKSTVGVNDLLPLYTTKKKGRSFLGVSNWTAMQISGSVTVKESQSGSTDVVCHFSYSAYYNGGALRSKWEQLESNGYLERAILTGLSDRLKAKPPEQAGAHKDIVSNELLLLAESTLDKLRKLDAAFKIDAEADIITTKLIDAQAQFDGFSAYQSSIDVSALRDQLGAALDGFRKARKAVAQDRNDALAQARSALARTTETIQALKPAAR